MHRSALVVTALFMAGACARPAHPTADDAPETVLPEHRMLRTSAFAPRVTEYAVGFRRATDSTERAYSKVTRTERPSPADPALAILTFEWSAPASSRDTLVIRRRGLAPVSERLDFGGATRRYTYDGARVTGSVQPRDSTPRDYAHTFEQRVFAFNEVELLVRSVPYRSGLRVVVPLFSEVDQALEHDTISVVGRGAPIGRDSSWIVRFADPVIVSDYIMDGTTREIRDIRTRNRKSGLVFHYALTRSAAL